MLVHFNLNNIVTLTVASGTSLTPASGNCRAHTTWNHCVGQIQKEIPSSTVERINHVEEGFHASAMLKMSSVAVVQCPHVCFASDLGAARLFFSDNRRPWQTFFERVQRILIKSDNQNPMVWLWIDRAQTVLRPWRLLAYSSYCSLCLLNGLCRYQSCFSFTRVDWEPIWMIGHACWLSSENIRILEVSVKVEWQSDIGK